MVDGASGAFVLLRLREVRFPEGGKAVIMGPSTHLLGCWHVFQDGVHAAYVKANPRVGVLHLAEGLQSTLPVLLVSCQHPFIPESDGLSQGHG